jgi:hypothetical protein
MFLDGVSGRRLALVLFVNALGFTVAACGHRTGTDGDTPPSNIQVASNVRLAFKPALGASNFPVPAADGPKLAPLAMAVPVRARPDRASESVGLLRVGARV